MIEIAPPCILSQYCHICSFKQHFKNILSSLSLSLLLLPIYLSAKSTCSNYLHLFSLGIWLLPRTIHLIRFPEYTIFRLSFVLSICHSMLISFMPPKHIDSFIDIYKLYILNMLVMIFIRTVIEIPYTRRK
jgi:hypothetical protein